MDINSILAASLSFDEKVSTSLTTLLTGFVVVFAVLILLIIIIAVYGKIVSTAQNKSEEKKKAKAEALKQAEKAEKEKSATVPVSAPNTVSGISDEIVAVIAAAVDSMYGAGNTKITGIKKSASVGRPVWGQAGVLDNTRPF